MKRLLPKLGEGNAAPFSTNLGFFPNYQSSNPIQSNPDSPIFGPWNTINGFSRYLYLSTGIRVGPPGTDGVVLSSDADYLVARDDGAPTWPEIFSKWWYNRAPNTSSAATLTRIFDGQLELLANWGTWTKDIFCVECQYLGTKRVFQMLTFFRAPANITSGRVTKSFEKNGTTYELVTHWFVPEPDAAVDTFPSDQFMITLVPYKAVDNLPGSSVVKLKTDREWPQIAAQNAFETFGDIEEGFSLYFTMGKASVASFQDWIIADLVESEDWANDPRQRPVNFVAQLGPKATHGTVLSAPLYRKDAMFEGAFTPFPTTYRVLPESLVRGVSKGTFGTGNGFVAGRVTVEEKAAVKRVRIFEKNSGVLVQQTMSAVDGTYRFDHLDLLSTYFVVSDDNKLVYNAVIADEIKPEAMP